MSLLHQVRQGNLQQILLDVHVSPERRSHLLDVKWQRQLLLHALARTPFAKFHKRPEALAEFMLHARMFVALCRARGMKLSGVDLRGRTALHILAKNAHTRKEHMHILFREGVDPLHDADTLTAMKMRDDKGRTPVDIICARPDVDLDDIPPVWYAGGKLSTELRKVHRHTPTPTNPQYPALDSDTYMYAYVTARPDSWDNAFVCPAYTELIARELAQHGHVQGLLRLFKHTWQQVLGREPDLTLLLATTSFRLVPQQDWCSDLALLLSIPPHRTTQRHLDSTLDLRHVLDKLFQNGNATPWAAKVLGSIASTWRQHVLTSPTSALSPLHTLLRHHTWGVYPLYMLRGLAGVPWWASLQRDTLHLRDARGLTPLEAAVAGLAIADDLYLLSVPDLVGMLNAGKIHGGDDHKDHEVVWAKALKEVLRALAHEAKSGTTPFRAHAYTRILAAFVKSGSPFSRTHLQQLVAASMDGTRTSPRAPVFTKELLAFMQAQPWWGAPLLTLGSRSRSRSSSFHPSTNSSTHSSTCLTPENLTALLRDMMSMEVGVFMQYLCCPAVDPNGGPSHKALYWLIADATQSALHFVQKFDALCARGARMDVATSKGCTLAHEFVRTKPETDVYVAFLGSRFAQVPARSALDVEDSAGRTPAALATALGKLKFAGALQQARAGSDSPFTKSEWVCPWPPRPIFVSTTPGVTQAHLDAENDCVRIPFLGDTHVYERTQTDADTSTNTDTYADFTLSPVTTSSDSVQPQTNTSKPTPSPTQEEGSSFSESSESSEGNPNPDSSESMLWSDEDNIPYGSETDDSVSTATQDDVLAHRTREKHLSFKYDSHHPDHSLPTYQPSLHFSAAEQRPSKRSITGKPTTETTTGPTKNSNTAPTRVPDFVALISADDSSTTIHQKQGENEHEDEEGEDEGYDEDDEDDDDEHELDDDDGSDDDGYDEDTDDDDLW
jgi:hypothetical protein